MLLDNILLFLTLAFLVLFFVTVIMHAFFLVPFVPSKSSVVAKMIEAAQLKGGDCVYDLGCGDGRLLFAAEKTAGITATGFEIAPLVYLLAKLRKFLQRAQSKVEFKNFFAVNLNRADVIFCYLIPNVMPRLSEKLKAECRPGTRIISNTFHIPDLTPSMVLEKDPKKGLPTIYVYTI